jgi:hypothetical protein
MISQELTEEFRQIMHEEYGHKIDSQEARELGTRLVKYFNLLLEINNKAGSRELSSHKGQFRATN